MYRIQLEIELYRLKLYVQNVMYLNLKQLMYLKRMQWLFRRLW